jgi:hypothetical protein
LLCAVVTSWTGYRSDSYGEGGEAKSNREENNDGQIWISAHGR